MRLKFIIVAVAFIILGLTACKKEETVNTDFCVLGDIWTFEIYDSVTPVHALDSFKFHQGSGFHTYYWSSGPQNVISFQVKKVTNDTSIIHYNSSIIHSLNGIYRGKTFTYNPAGTDTIATIEYQSTKHILNLGPVSVDYDGDTKTLKACRLEMTDVNP